MTSEPRHRGDGSDESQQPRLHDFADTVKIVGDLAQHFSRLIAVEEAQRKPLDLRADLLAQRQVEVFGHGRHQIGLQVVEAPLAEIQDCQNQDRPADTAGVPAY